MACKLKKKKQMLKNGLKKSRVNFELKNWKFKEKKIAHKFKPKNGALMQKKTAAI